MPKHVVAGAAYDALMTFDEQLQLGMQRYLQLVNYVNLDNETTAVFVETFSRSASREQGRGRGWATAVAAGGDAARGACRSIEKQPTKQSTRQDAGDVAGGGRRRTLRLSSPAVTQPQSDAATSYTHYSSRTQHQRWCEY